MMVKDKWDGNVVMEKFVAEYGQPSVRSIATSIAI